jgi:predicted acetyltransferase
MATICAATNDFQQVCHLLSLPTFLRYRVMEHAPNCLSMLARDLVEKKFQWAKLALQLYVTPGVRVERGSGVAIVPELRGKGWAYRLRLQTIRESKAVGFGSLLSNALALEA